MTPGVGPVRYAWLDLDTQALCCRYLVALAPAPCPAQPKRQSATVQVFVVSHSWGDAVFRCFMAWVSVKHPQWVESHMAAFANIAGPTLGVPKSIASFLSGAPPPPLNLRPPQSHGSTFVVPVLVLAIIIY